MATLQGKVRREELLNKFKNDPRPRHEIMADPDVVAALRQDAAENGENAVIPASLLEDHLKLAQMVRERPAQLAAADAGSPVILVPGFLGSSLTDTTGGNELIWIDPTLVIDGGQLSALQLRPWNPAVADHDLVDSVTIVPTDEVPLAYDVLKWGLSLSGYSVQVFPFDWRKNIDESAQRLAQQIRTSVGTQKVRLIAHSQGSLVARRALHILGDTEADRLVESLVLLGPATFGTFTAAMAISGAHKQLQLFQNWAINAPPNVAAIFQSMSGLYQLLPWNPQQFPSENGQPLFDVRTLSQSTFWKTNVDSPRLNDLWSWAKGIDTSFFNAKTRIILGDDKSTTAGVKFENGQMIETIARKQGDGVVLDECAKLPGVRAYKATGAKHAWMASAFNVTRAVLRIFDGQEPTLVPSALPLADAEDQVGIIPVEHVVLQPAVPQLPTTTPTLADPTATTISGNVAPPHYRRLRVFSVDPLLMLDPKTASYATMELELPWTDVGIGPVGEYIEVVDVDPQSNLYYEPVNLNHPYILAQNGLSPSETDPQFHQQMVFAVANATIRVFELALGRTVLWSPRLERNAAGEVVQSNKDPFVRRLRIYPHAMRQRNAYYDPERKALLFGYFPSRSAAGTVVQPGATVFTCLSFDVVAHETTHALLDGVHRYFTTRSNRDVFAFHEAFADIVGLLQRFSNRDLMQRQMRLAKGKLTDRSLIGQMALQFGVASNERSGLRRYLGEEGPDGQWRPIKPTPEQLLTENEPHKRGALLVAAMYQALNSMYEQRSNDMFDVARRDDGNVTFSRELENRLAMEASTAAKHLLKMAIRAIDYVPPVDITFGDYLRGLITADYDVESKDSYHYRAAIVNAFSQWGIYPSDRGTLIPDDLRWDRPSPQIAGSLLEWLQNNPIADWVVGADRANIYRENGRLAASLHEWIMEFAPACPRAYHQQFGLDLDQTADNKSIRRNAKGIPVFEVHSVRPSRRIDPDGETRRCVVIEIVQRRKAFFDEAMQAQVDNGTISYESAKQDFYFRGGCTLIVDSNTGEIRYLMSKNISSETRLRAERAFRSGRGPERKGNEFREMHGDDE